MINLPIRDELFWDINFRSMDDKKNKQIIIERVLSFGNVAEFIAIERFYGQKTIKKVLSKIGYFDPKTLEFIKSYYSIKQSDLKCFIKKLPGQKHWI
jgi:hypothetical protein